MLDTGVLVALQRAGHLSILVDISERVTLVMLEEVRDELIVDAKPKHAKAAEQARITLEGSRIRVEEIQIADPAAARLQALRAGKTSASDLGEAASIAWAMSRPEASFVTRDGQAALLGLEELRGRAMGFFQFLAELVDLGALDVSVAGQVAEDTVKASGVTARVPLWWPDWIQSHSPPTSSSAPIEPEPLEPEPRGES
ncbi:hypothetical protein WME98_28435 [Sorangium sp. So ce296]|uniref:hypothetical protein n=1 Tax=Sorangium sp. So ce296 TaxID=3133296 RepID=UPI003F6038EF